MANRDGFRGANDGPTPYVHSNPQKFAPEPSSRTPGEHGLWLDDGDIRLYHGDALETVRAMPDGSVDCVVTSPPYWGLRDYGTGEWDGGDPDCDHVAPPTGGPQPLARPDDGGGQGMNYRRGNDGQYRTECRKCGARRVDRQMGLEPTPDLFVAGMVELFREIRRVLAPHGTCWVNLGDSYNANQGAGFNGQKRQDHANRNTVMPNSGVKAKDLVGIPWRFAFALQQDGWWLRSDIIWAKPNPMPESVTDRPTKAHEYVFLLTKQPRYWFDTEAVRERVGEATRRPTEFRGGNVYSAFDNTNGGRRASSYEEWPDSFAARNVRSVWQIATQPYPEAHFATYPEELARRCILAGCPIRVCRVCGKPSERIVERPPTPWSDTRTPGKHTAVSAEKPNGNKVQEWLNANPPQTVGWSDCGHNQWRPGQVLDPFIGSGTTAKVARDHQRHAIGIDLNHEYLELAARRLQQLSLLNYDPNDVPARGTGGLTGGAYNPPGQSPHGNAR